LAESLRCSQRTLQEAIRRLQADGLVDCRRRSATLLLRREPSRFRVGVLFLPARCGNGWSRLDQLIDHLAHGPVVADCSLDCYAGLGSADGDRQRLTEDLAHHRLDAAILRGEPDECADLLTATGRLPLVAIGARNQRSGVPCLHLGHLDAVDAGIERLVALGCRRPAVLTHAGLPRISRRIQQSLLRRGLPDHLVLDVHHDHERGAEQLVRLLLGQVAGQRPDGLLVAIDSLAPAVARLLAADPAEARGLRLVVHANQPAGPAPPWPCDSVGFDLAEVIMRGVSSLRQLAAGLPVPGMTTMRLWRSWATAAAG
jgi:DNA-binding LacI/PurR family transcriptional regulator